MAKDTIAPSEINGHKLKAAEKKAEKAAEKAKKPKHEKHKDKAKHSQAKEAAPIEPATIEPATIEHPASEDGDRAEKSKDQSKKLSDKVYEAELAKLQIELVKMQYWIKAVGYRVIVIFEGRDAAGKGGVIQRITEPLNPRGCRVVALGTPSDREKTEWYFQRYAAHLPAAGEIALFDRSWYNRAGVERVMGFCTEAQYREFFVSCPEFERMLVRSGILLLKYWFSVSDEEQEKRFHDRAKDPIKRWKLSPIDLKSRDRWVDYSKAKDEMFSHTNIPEAPWFTVAADDKKRARLNCMSHILSKIPYEDMTPPPIELPPRASDQDYVRPPFNEQFFVPQVY